MNIIARLKNKYFNYRVNSILAYPYGSSKRAQKILCKYGGIKARDRLVWDHRYLQTEHILALIRIGDKISLDYVRHSINETLVESLGENYCTQYQRILMEISVDPFKRYDQKIRIKAVEALCKDFSMAPFLKDLLMSSEEHFQEQLVSIYGNHLHLLNYLNDIAKDKTGLFKDSFTKSYAIREIGRYEFMIPSSVEILLGLSLKDDYWTLKDISELLRKLNWSPKKIEECLIYSITLDDVNQLIDFPGVDLDYILSLIKNEDMPEGYNLFKINFARAANKKYGTSFSRVVIDYIENFKGQNYNYLNYLIKTCADSFYIVDVIKLRQSLDKKHIFDRLQPESLKEIIKKAKGRNEEEFKNLIERVFKSNDNEKKIIACELIDNPDYKEFEGYLTNLLLSEQLSSIKEEQAVYYQGRLVQPLSKACLIKEAAAGALKRIDWQPITKLEQTNYYFFNSDFSQMIHDLGFIKEMLILSKRNPLIFINYLKDFFIASSDKEIKTLLIDELRAIHSSHARGKKFDFEGYTIDPEYYEYAEAVINTVIQVGGEDLQESLLWFIKNEDLDKIRGDFGYGLRQNVFEYLKDFLNEKTIKLLKDILNSKIIHLTAQALSFIKEWNVIDVVDDLILFTDDQLTFEEKTRHFDLFRDLSFELSTSYLTLKQFYPNINNAETKVKINNLIKKVDIFLNRSYGFG